MGAAFRIALVGLGDVAGYHLAAIQGLGRNIELVLGIDPCAQRRAATQLETAPELTTSHLAALDAVVVATPTDTHTALAIEALTAGCAVLVEKPAADSISRWRELLATAESCHVPLHTALHARFSPERRWFQQAKRWLIAEHGPLCALHSQAFDPYVRGPELQSRAKSLGGSWLDSGINVLSGIDMCLEDWSVTSVRHVASHGIDDTATVATLRFSRRGLNNAGLGVIETSWHAEKSWKETVLSFEESGAQLRLIHSRHQAILQLPNGETQTLFQAPLKRRRLFTHYVGVYRQFLRVLMGEKDNRQLSDRLHRALLGP